MNKQIVLLVVGFLVLVAGVILLIKTAPEKETVITAPEMQNIPPTAYTETNEVPPTITPPSAPVAETVAVPTAVTLTKDGFSPSAITIKKGTAVTWTNTSDGKMLVATAMHPTHTVYGGTTMKEHCPDTANNSFDQCVPGNSFTFTFDKVGEWKYHNHVIAGQYGSVTVTE